MGNDYKAGYTSMYMYVMEGWCVKVRVGQMDNSR